MNSIGLTLTRSFRMSCADDIQSQKPPAAMMMTRSPEPASVQIPTFLGAW
jgi:hypothetical protein